MKTKKFVLSAVLTAFLALPAFGQYGTYNDSSKSGTSGHSMMMGKPVYESTVQGTHLKVWIMSQEERNKWMNSKTLRDSSGMDRLGTDKMGTDNQTGNDRMGTDNRTGNDRMGTDNRTGNDRMGTNSRMGTDTSKWGTGTSGAVGMGTHHVMVEATDASTNQSLRDITGTLQVTSPSMKTTSVDLNPMANHYGADVNLDEQGQYQFTLNLTVDGTSKTAQFQYTPTTNKSMMDR